ncbi:hypothetical protein BDR26DRAFT_283231 [Obelidium mucronatum]|nr:hypothetical protein BDR26DRAFT_283231 [Obelidium mucronatum]
MATVVLLALLPLIRADSCSTYTSGYCTPFVNYPIFVATGGSIAAQEAKLKAGGMDLLLTLNASNPANRPCVSAFLEWACYTSYPSCANDALQNVPCKSVCANSVSQCKTLFGMFGKTNSLPNCEDSVQGLTVPYGTTPSCLGYSATPTSSDVAKPTGQPPAPASCPSFLIRNPDYNTSNPSQSLTPVLGRQCNGPCCVPCPHVHQFYDPNNFQSLNIANQVLVVLSFCGSSFIVLSYLVFPSKREHPGAIMWFFSLGIFLYHLFQLSIIGSDGYRVSCVDEITESKQQNNTLCAVQAFIQTFAALYLIFWINMFILNLHLTVVWRKDWFTDKYVYYRIFSLIYAFIPAIGVLATGSGASIGYSCLADVRNVKGFILYPYGRFRMARRRTDNLYSALLDSPFIKRS